VREAPVLTLVVGPAVLETGGRAVAFRHILVPLDGSHLAETALGPAERVAKIAGARLTLVRAARWASQVYPTFDPVSLNEELAAAAEKYLSDVRQRVEEVPADTRLLRGPPADTLIEFARDQHVDLVIMASHTRSGAARAALGSVADRMIHGPAPVLVVRADDARAAGS
jgi:nucleotide-binding universal stress UspA family protein